ncbi:MAG: rod shape-determining protein MreD [Candidatus Saganbacteria bacterium]|nr:rod shape-determining protein MreD [Candidatus Saganbacteria bacterium]
MRSLKFGLYLLALFVLQTVVFPRLNLFGVAPDLVLIFVVGCAVTAEPLPANLLAAGCGLFQDLLSAGPYLNLLLKVVIVNAGSAIKEGFAGDELSLSAWLIALFTPLHLIIEALVVYFFFERQFSPFYLAGRVALATLYNLLLLPLLFPLVKALNDAG